MQACVQPRSEDVGEDLFPLVCVGLQQAAEIALRDHADLRELLPAQADDLANGPIHLLELCDGAAVRLCQLCVRGLRRHPRAARFGAFIRGIPPYGVGAAVVGKRQLHIGRRFRLCVFGAEHCGLAAVAAGLAEEREGDGVENGRLAGAGIAGDEIEPAAPEALKVQLLHTGVGAKARNRQFQRSHGRSSQMDSISSCANARCSPLIGWLFCAS